MDHDVSGAAFCQNDKKMIFINRNELIERRNFDLAHELFHVLTWDSMPPSKIDIDNSKSKNEKLANSFASGLLTPQVYLKEYWDSKISLKLHNRIIDTARHFGVTGKALFWRLVNLGWINKDDIDPEKLTFHKEGSMPLLYSKIFVKNLHGVLSEGLVSVKKAMSLLNCSKDDLNALLKSYSLSIPFDY
jgi:Zn-dependent peptidase ImmA (M78 family)